MAVILHRGCMRVVIMSYRFRRTVAFNNSLKLGGVKFLFFLK